MARGLQLQALLSMLRAEVGDAQSVALGVNAVEGYKNILRRVQETLWLDHEWPHLRHYVDDPLPAGTRYHQYPAGLDFERSIVAWGKDTGDWEPLVYGITPEMLNTWDSDAGQRSSPLRAWQHQADNNGYEVWPIPLRDTAVRFRGTAPLKPLVKETDVCTLDSQIIVLFAAAEILQSRDRKDAEAKLATAQNTLRRLKALQGAKKSEPFVMGGAPMGPRLRYGIDYV